MKTTYKQQMEAIKFVIDNDLHGDKIMKALNDAYSTIAALNLTAQHAKKVSKK